MQDASETVFRKTSRNLEEPEDPTKTPWDVR